MHILIIDNYDSFTYNLYQNVGEILSDTGKHFKLDVIRNDELTLHEIEAKKYDKIIISPGPGDPSDKAYFGICSEVILELGKTTPLLGVCLGMQGIAHYFGGKVVRAKLPMHGKISQIKHSQKGLFNDLPQNLEVMRYHSLVVDEGSLPDSLEVTAFVENENGLKEIMALQHKKYTIYGIQFHPESFATEGGKQILTNFLSL